MTDSPSQSKSTSTTLHISLFGPLALEWVDADGERSTLPRERLAGRGVAPALGLLKALLCCPHRFATRDWLLEQFWPDTTQSKAEERLNDVASGLRTLLRPVGSSDKILHYVYGTSTSGSGYRLEDYPLIWVDADAFCWYVEQATRFERFGQDALPLWERAYQLAARGPFLLEERYSEWACESRDLLAAQYRQCVHRVASLLRERGAREQALLRLRTYWQSHSTDEDALRPLMELLGEQERYQEAEACYHQLLAALAQENTERQPAAQTQDLYEFLHAWQIQREQGQADHRKAMKDAQTMTSYQPSVQPISTSPGMYFSIQQSPALEYLNPANMSLSIPSLLRSDVDVLTRLSTILNQSSVVHEREITYFDHQTRLYWRAREETALPAPTLYTYVIRHLDDINTLLGRSLSPTLRLFVCEIICRTVLLAGILLYDIGHYEQARQHYQVAWKAAMEANNFVLQGIVWGWMSFTWTYTKRYVEALYCVQQARHFAAQTSDTLVQAWLGAIEAEIQAHLHNRAACLQSLTLMEHSSEVPPSQDISYLFEFNPVLLLGYKGVCLQQLYRQDEPETYGFLREAKESLELALASEAPLKRKLYYLSDLAGAYARQGEVETACAYVAQSIPLITQIGSGSKTIRKHLLQARLLLQPNEHTSFVRVLDEQMAPLLLEMQET
jgi:DNA-binding SARP family transcriptional activator